MDGCDGWMTMSAMATLASPWSSRPKASVVCISPCGHCPHWHIPASRRVCGLWPLCWPVTLAKPDRARACSMRTMSRHGLAGSDDQVLLTLWSPPPLPARFALPVDRRRYAQCAVKDWPVQLFLSVDQWKAAKIGQQRGHWAPVNLKCLAGSNRDSSTDNYKALPRRVLLSSQSFAITHITTTAPR